MYNEVKYLIAGDRAIVMEFGNEINKDINAKIRSTMAAIDGNIEGIVEMTPTYRSITIVYEPEKLSYSDLVEQLKRNMRVFLQVMEKKK